MTKMMIDIMRMTKMIVEMMMIEMMEPIYEDDIFLVHFYIIFSSFLKVLFSLMDDIR